MPLGCTILKIVCCMWLLKYHRIECITEKRYWNIHRSRQTENIIDHSQLNQLPPRQSYHAIKVTCMRQLQAWIAPKVEAVHRTKSCFYSQHSGEKKSCDTCKNKTSAWQNIQKTSTTIMLISFVPKCIMGNKAFMNNSQWQCAPYERKNLISSE